MGVTLCGCRKNGDDLDIGFAKLDEDCDLEELISLAQNCETPRQTQLTRSFQSWQRSPGQFFWKASVKDLQQEIGLYQAVHQSVLIPVIFSIIYWWDTTLNEFIDSQFHIFQGERGDDFITRITNNLPRLLFHECTDRETLEKRLDGLCCLFATDILTEQVAQHFFYSLDACYHAEHLSFLFDMVNWKTYLDDPQWCGWYCMKRSFLEDILDIYEERLTAMHVFLCMLSQSGESALECVQYLTFDCDVKVAGYAWVFSNDQIPTKEERLAVWHDCQLCLAAQGALVFYDPIHTELSNYSYHRQEQVLNVAQHYLQFIKIHVLKEGQYWPRSILDDIYSFLNPELMLPVTRMRGNVGLNSLVKVQNLPITKNEVPNPKKSKSRMQVYEVHKKTNRTPLSPRTSQRVKVNHHQAATMI